MVMSTFIVSVCQIDVIFCIDTSMGDFLCNNPTKILFIIVEMGSIFPVLLDKLP